MRPLTEMMTFVRVVELKSFSEAARELQTSKSMVSKQITTLEAALGVRLLNRTTRRMSLTDIGSAFYEHCTRISAEIDAARQTASQYQLEPRGVLRVTAPIMFSALHLSPVIDTFVRAHPLVTLELDTSDRVADLVDEGFDVAIRITRSPAPGTVVHKLAEFDWVTCAAPTYLAARGTPQSPRDLLGHNCLVHQPTHALHTGWDYGPDNKATTIPVLGNCRANSLSVLHALAVRGAGIGRFPRYLAGDDLREARLCEVLATYRSPASTALYLTFMPNRYMQPKVRAFIDHLQQCFSGRASWEHGQ